MSDDIMEPTPSTPEELWAAYFDTKEDVALENGDVFRTYRAGSSGPHVVLLHGGGYASMTWSLVTALLKEHCVVHAFDLRGHGATHTARDEDLSMGTLVQDTLAVVARLVPTESGDDSEAEQPQIVLLSALVGVMVIDVVEGTAMASLSHMHGILDRRPRRFRSYPDAVAWSLHSGTIRNPEAANVSIPSQLKALPDGSLTWRTDLECSAEYWRDWFVGLSEQFLALKTAKILVLAGSDRLDTALVRGQMMGKFELRLLYGSGHVIQEDCPDQVTAAIREFCARCARTTGGAVYGGPDGATRQPSLAPPPANAILAAKLAKARGMVPH
ncbi:hypothetical protein PybrP1_002200 [[Pythium] brassicae (nom. inval.)]|nr:hypothetical protein PybrP1_002200 [[Pythium] brassicae (nom. inval.)]